MTAGRIVPLAGIVAVVLVVVSAIVAGETPDTDAPVNEVVSFYTDNDTDQQAGGIIFAYAALFFLFFASLLRNALRRGEADVAGASTLGFAGAIVFAIGILIFAGISFAVGTAADDLEPTSLQALHALNNELFAPLAVGAFAFLLGTGIAIVRTAALPKWLGWVAIVAALPSLTPAFFVSGLVLGVWIIVVSVLLSLRGSPAGTA